MSTYLNGNNLLNTQQMEVAIHGPDGATHLILCTGMVNLAPVRQGSYIFPVGPLLSRRQFVAVIVSGAISTIQARHRSTGRQDDEDLWNARLLSIEAIYDEEACQVKVIAEVLFGPVASEMAISYNVSILAELQSY